MSLLFARGVFAALSPGAEDLSFYEPPEKVRLEVYDPRWEKQVDVRRKFKPYSEKFKHVKLLNDSGVFAANLRYSLEGDLSAVSFEAKLGISFNSTSPSAASPYDLGALANLGYGVAANYAVKLSREATLGPKVSYIVLTQNTQEDLQLTASFSYHLY